MKNIKSHLPVWVAVTASVLVPAISYAASLTLKGLASIAAEYLNIALRLLMGFAVLMFVWYVIQYFIRGGESQKSRTEAGQYILWSIIGFFVILSFWGLVNILTSTFDLNSSAPTWNSIDNLFPR